MDFRKQTIGKIQNRDIQNSKKSPSQRGDTHLFRWFQPKNTLLGICNYDLGKLDIQNDDILKSAEKSLIHQQCASVNFRKQTIDDMKTLILP